METRSKKASKLAISTAKTKIPSLPSEIISNIIRYLSPDDVKHTLAQCMRVSPTFNAIAAPRLYRCVDLDSSLGLVARYTAKPRPSRKTITKAGLIGLIRVLKVPFHSEYRCPSDLAVRKGVEWKVTTLKLYDTGVFFPRSCACFRSMFPRKLVLRNATSYNRVHESLFAKSSLETLVLVMDMSAFGHSLTMPIPLDAKPHCPKKAVYVLLSPDPGRWTTSNQIHLRQCLGKVAMSALSTLFPNDITIVNIQALESRSIAPLRANDYQFGEYCDTYIRKCLRDYPAALGDYRSKGTSAQKDAGTMEKIKVHFVDMETYLSDYDWEDEFSPKDVQGWLDEMERKKEQKRKEEQDGDVGGSKKKEEEGGGGRE